MTTLRQDADVARGPLGGVPLAVAGGGTAGTLAARHLRALGCTTAPARELATTAGQAARLALGPGPADPAADGTERDIDCVIDWAGPVDLPLASEADAQAACGIAAVHGRRYGAPTPLGIDYAGAVAGVLAVQGLLAARCAGLRGAPVRGVRTSVAGAALLAVGQYLAAATADDPDRTGRPDRTAPEDTAPKDTAPEGTPPESAAADPPFTSRDGVRFEIESLDAGPWLEFWTRLGVDRHPIGRGWPSFQLRFSSAQCPLPPELAATAAQSDYHEIVTAAGRAGVGIVPVREDAPAPPPTPPWQIARAGGRPPRPAGPIAPRTGGVRLPLAGLVVVEMTRRLQGPLAGHLLALLGAELVRIEPLGGDPLRGVPPMAGDDSARFHALNRGKRAVEADPRAPSGRRAIRELVGDADVFLHNLAPGKAEAFGLGAPELLAVQPGLVHAWASGWGELLGPEPPVGTDYLVQARSGLAALVTPAGRPATPSLMTITDIFGGLISAEGVLAALVAREVTGHGRRVDSSLWSAATELLRTGTPPAARRTAFAAATPDEIARDSRFRSALHRDRCLLPCSPWEFDR
ncbi:CoA transferase [Kitasatospora sp. NPDC052896]|uniref:CoA transferase n=1 Tax=Kitasatospora sp. NPDC052896 TaxID=3364061 RepID=UPI0037C92C49